MSNYPNMSYCMCENTSLALKQVLNAMQEYESMEEFVEDMGREEMRAFKGMELLCEKFVNLISDMREYDAYTNKESVNA